jgi:hypothetical protein
MHSRKRRVESFEKMPREGKIKRKVNMEKKRKNNRKVKKEKKI